MTYEVDVGGKFIIIKKPPEKLLENWEDFEINPLDDKTVRIHLSGRSSHYADIIAQLIVLGQYFKGRLRGHGEDGSQVEVNIPPTKEEIIHASERKIWGTIETHKTMKVDRIMEELEDINFKELYPKWLEEIPKKSKWC